MRGARALVLALASLEPVPAPAAAAPAAPSDAPPRGEERPAARSFLPLTCTAAQTGGFHDHPGDDEGYVASLFHASHFRLEKNRAFELHLGAQQPAVDLYVTLSAEDPLASVDLECRSIRGADGSDGYSCANVPPSELLLINRDSLRFTRTAVGGWVFTGPAESRRGDSIFVEYGTCRPAEPRAAPLAPGEDISP